MNRTEVTALLAKAQVFDNRTVTDLQVSAWLGIMSDIDITDAMAAVDDHVRSSGDYLQPHHIVELAAKRRQARAALQAAQAIAITAGITPRAPWEQDALRIRMQTAFNEGRATARATREMANPRPHDRWCNTTHDTVGTDECPPHRPAAKGVVVYVRGPEKPGGLALRPPEPVGPRVSQSHAHCGWSDCQCTHTEPCEGGWIALPDEEGCATVRACPVCAPNRANILSTAASRREASAALRDTLRQYR